MGVLTSASTPRLNSGVLGWDTRRAHARLKWVCVDDRGGGAPRLQWVGSGLPEEPDSSDEKLNSERFDSINSKGGVNVPLPLELPPSGGLVWWNPHA